MPSDQYKAELFRKRELRDRGIDPYGPEAADLDDARELNAVEEERLLYTIWKRADAVAASYRDHQEAIMAERKVKSEVLERALVLVRPALKALASKIEKRVEWHGGALPGPHDVKQWHDDRGILLVNKTYVVEDPADKEEDCGLRGKFGGASLYLIEDGRLGIAKVGGIYSNVPGEISVRTTEIDAVSVREAVEAFDIRAALQGLANVLQQQGGRDRATAQAKDVTAKLGLVLEAVLKAVRR